MSEDVDKKQIRDCSDRYAKLTQELIVEYGFNPVGFAAGANYANVLLSVRGANVENGFEMSDEEFKTWATGIFETMLDGMMDVPEDKVRHMS